MTITPRFVEFVPETLENGILYISEKYNTAIHTCCCGCGEEVVTPLTPVDWRLHKYGHAVTLTPSIGNWNYACQSHYWIRANKVVWAPTMSRSEIRRVQARDRSEKARFIANQNAERMISTQRFPWIARIWSNFKKWWQG